MTAEEIVPLVELYVTVINNKTLTPSQVPVVAKEEIIKLTKEWIQMYGKMKCSNLVDCIQDIEKNNIEDYIKKHARHLTFDYDYVSTCTMQAIVDACDLNNPAQKKMVIDLIRVLTNGYQKTILRECSNFSGGGPTPEPKNITEYITELLSPTPFETPTQGGRGDQSMILLKTKHMCKDGKCRNVYKIKGQGNAQFVKTNGKLVKLSDLKNKTSIKFSKK